MRFHSCQPLRHTREVSGQRTNPLCPPPSSIPWGWRGLLELLQAAHQLSLLVRRHAGEHGGSDEDLQRGKGSVFVSQHPASLRAQEEPGYFELCQFSRAEGILHRQKKKKQTTNPSGHFVLELRGRSMKPQRGQPCRRIPRRRTHLRQQVGEVLANHGEGLAVQREVAGLRLEEAAVPLVQTLPRKTTPFSAAGLRLALKSLPSPWATA